MYPYMSLFVSPYAEITPIIPSEIRPEIVLLTLIRGIFPHPCGRSDLLPPITPMSWLILSLLMCRVIKTVYPDASDLPRPVHHIINEAVSPYSSFGSLIIDQMSLLAPTPQNSGSEAPYVLLRTNVLRK